MVLLYVICPGDASLINLRKAIIQAEMNNGNKHYRHIVPLIRHNDITAILQHAGFKESVIDHEKIILENSSPIRLMHMLKKHGESNISNILNEYSISKNIYRDLLNHKSDQGNFIDQIVLITFIASKKRNNIKYNL